MNIREISKFAHNYYAINREERNYAAIFFSALCIPGNAEKFLSYCGFYEKIGQNFGIYFEYAYLRDLWYNISNEEIKKKIIKEKLQIGDIDHILNLSPFEINKKFGVSGVPSNQFIQYPGKWSIQKYHKNFRNDNDFIKICKFKWSFNIKPDIVIHLDKNRSICIEAKYESGEGSYPVSDLETKIFKDRQINKVGQMELQKYMMEELLGIETDFLFLVYKKEKSETHKVISWVEAFEILDIESMPVFAKEMIKNIGIN